MDPIQLLMAEHRLIERVLGALEREAETIAQGGGRPETVALFVEFLREFADGLHHGKEEKLLFEQMVLGGFPKKAGPIAVMLHEHDEGRTYLRVLDEVGSKDVWNEGDRSRLAQAARAYTGLLRAHIGKEDGILYPIARSMPGERYLELTELTARFEEDTAGERERLLALAEALAGPAR